MPSLADQLADITNPAPKDFDPEDSYATYKLERNEGQGDLDAGRRDYVDVGTSQLRKKGEAVLDGKYSGRRASRKDLEEEESEEEEEEDSEEEEEEDSEEEEGESQDTSEEEDEESDDSEDKSDNDATAHKRQQLLSDDKKIVKKLVQSAHVDIEKGRHIKKQLKLADTLYEFRIKLQKALTAANALPPKDSTFVQSLGEAEQSLLSDTLERVSSLSESLFASRERLFAKNDAIALPDDFGMSRKRKREEDDSGPSTEYISSTLSDLHTLDETLDPYLRSTVTKWSDKVLAAQGIKQAKFKSVNQNAMRQIETILGGGDSDRLLRRTRLNRSHVKLIGRENDSVDNTYDDLYDDGDFYQQLLKQVVESRLVDLDSETQSLLKRKSKVKKQVDTKASKGRKLRYDVHEKLQGIMIPVRGVTWHDDQIDELFRGLLGGDTTTNAEELQEEPSVADTGLRIFG